MATAEQIVRTPEEGAPVALAVEDAKGSLQKGLLKLASESNPQLQC